MPHLRVANDFTGFVYHISFFYGPRKEFLGLPLEVVCFDIHSKSQRRHELDWNSCLIDLHARDGLQFSLNNAKVF
jgi:hypothetical protein